MKALTVTQYAKKKRKSRQAILKAISKGTIKANKIGNQYIIYSK